ncbi:MAG: nucleotidyltransferase family protein [Alphaproteobacteria bacterium]|nr:nucleotidyltransferase family protein [Alphaproteobacteria bacterium]
MTKNKSPCTDRVTSALRDPSAVVAWSERDWDRAIRHARRAGLLARLALLIAERGLDASVPQRARGHLEAACVLARKHGEDVARELRYIAETLAAVQAPVILLKGASYAAAGLPASAGRLFGDIDILVPRPALAAAEAALVASGWGGVKQDEYDQRYYRRWMHEIPPLQHRTRRTTVDVHHTIVPPTGRHAVDARRMIDWAVPAQAAPGFLVLSPPDMILHAAVHLFDDGEWTNGLRDLDDINRLLRHFAALSEFWQVLATRAAQLGLERPLYYALRNAAALLDAPVPQRLLSAPDLRPPARPVLRWMDFVFARALRPAHADCALPFTRLALSFLYVRAHCLRMPLRLLLPHLLRKAVVKRFKPAEA